MHLAQVELVLKSSFFFSPLHSLFQITNFRAAELLTGEEKKDHDSGAHKSESNHGVRPEDYELILSDPLLRDGCMSWPLDRINTVGFGPGTLFVGASFQQIANFNCD
jgi:hypothetical protein